MSLYSALTDKPWEANSDYLNMPLEDKDKTRRVGLRVLLAVVSMLFFLFLIAFLMRSQYPDWQPLAENPSNPLFHKSTLWGNSAYLVFASVLIQWARMITKTANSGLLKVLVSVGGLFCAAFVAGQFLLWSSLYEQGHVVSANPALSFFYLFTGLHAAHVLIGLIGWLVTLTLVFSHRPKAHLFIELCAIYWHFLLVLWIGLFALLTSKPETYDAIAAFCGLR
jgi:cytochrome c oxidase subunit 3